MNIMKDLHRSNLLQSLLILCSLTAAISHRAGAHPMGNFSINHLSRLEAHKDRIALDYRLDFAEIPTLAERNAIDQDGNNDLTSAEQSTYKRSKVAALSQNLKLSVNNKALRLRVQQLQMQWNRGAGGLSTLRLTMRGLALLPPSKSGVRLVQYADTNFATRAGWKEVIAVAARDATLRQSNAPSIDVTRGLTAYPSTATPPQRTEASFQLVVGNKPAAPARRSQGTALFRLIGTDTEGAQSTLDARDAQGDAQRNASSFQLVGSDDASPRGESPNTESASSNGTPTSDGTSAATSNTPQDAFTQAIAENKLTPRLMLGGLLLAFFFGASHALSPGHGKTMVAAYLVGERGTWRHAMMLGVVVTVTHTLGVFLLGTAVWFASATVEPDRLYPILSTASGLMIFSVGLWLLQQRLARLSAGGSPHSHHHGDHDHNGHDHSHDHGEHGHSHVPQGPITMRALIALGVSGGIVPCPSALIVLLSSIALHRVGYGLVLISVFSLGLASVLIAIGCAVVSAQSWINRSEKFKLPPAMGGLVRFLPVVSAAAVTFIGLMLTWSALGPVKP